MCARAVIAAGDDPEIMTSLSTTPASSTSPVSSPPPVSSPSSVSSASPASSASASGDNPEFVTSPSTTSAFSASSKSLLEVLLNNPVVEKVVNAREELSSDELMWEEERLARAVVSTEDMLEFVTIRSTIGLFVNHPLPYSTSTWKSRIWSSLCEGMSVVVETIPSLL